jgi:hypothetical protein
MTPPEPAAIKPEAKKVNVAAKPGRRPRRKPAPRGLVSIGLRAPADQMRSR